MTRSRLVRSTVAWRSSEAAAASATRATWSSAGRVEHGSDVELDHVEPVGPHRPPPGPW
ncbi:MAG: hypothetical protein R2761_02550 [Acidimicrobiales bacterium]